MTSYARHKKHGTRTDWRFKALRVFFFVFAGIIALRLLSLQVVSAGFYQSLASGQHDVYQELVAERGTIYVTDWKDDWEYAAATNEARAFLYAEPRKIEDPQYTAQALAQILGYEMEEEEVIELLSDGVVEGEEVSVEIEKEPNEYERLLERLSKSDDPYEPIARNIPESTLDKILAMELEGIHYILEDVRSYPEMNLGGHLFGFVAQRDNETHGQYGLEGHYEEFLAGTNGFLNAQTDSVGRWIGVGEREFEPANDGGDILLTIDRTIQYEACRRLKAGVDRFDADGGSVIILEPKTGRIIAMCNGPDFDPNAYSNVEDVDVYNNDGIFTAYEPGSVFKPIVMAAALDAGVVTPNTTYEDFGEEKIDRFTIRNSDLKAHGIQTMTQVLEKSLNTGMIFVMREMGGELMTRFIEDFGFGTLTGIDLDTEVGGDVSALYKDQEIYYATASYGQGITATPMQIAAAYGAIANGGWLMQPYVVEEKRYPNGTVEHASPRTVRQVLDSSAATTIGAMLVSVIENGHATHAAVDGYYIAGKTGTAQVAQGGSYVEGITNATFAGFGPVENPRFVMVVKLEHPRASIYAADTAAPIFGDIAEFMLDYLEVAPTR